VLTKKREEERKAEVLGLIKEATGKVVVQFDKNTPYDIVTKEEATAVHRWTAAPGRDPKSRPGRAARGRKVPPA
jgi:hypothetical protein